MSEEDSKILVGSKDDTPRERIYPLNEFVPTKDPKTNIIDGEILVGPDAKIDHSKDEVDALKVGNILRSNGHHNNENDINAPNMRTKKGFFGKVNL